MKVTLLGDSLAEGYAVDEKQYWGYLVQKKLKNINIVNEGIRGDTTAGMLARLTSGVIDKDSKMVMLLGGTNDLIAGVPLGVIKGNIMSMTHISYHYNILPIIGIEPRICEPLLTKRWDGLCNFSRLNDDLEALREWILRFSNTFDCLVFDIFETFTGYDSDYSYLFSDGLHPSILGNQVIADCFVELLEKVLFLEK